MAKTGQKFPVFYWQENADNFASSVKKLTERKPVSA
jgi:hypothetical protein